MVPLPPKMVAVILKARVNVQVSADHIGARLSPNNGTYPL